jgi:hypothetical protein
VSKQFADDRQAETGAGANAGEGMAQNLDAKAGKRCGLGHCGPGLFKIGAGDFRAGARDDEWSQTIQ